MCGRFAIVSPASELIEAFGLASAPAGVRASYNVAPTQTALVIPNRPRRELDLFKWGLVPSWAKDERIGNRMINARAETLAEKPSFANAFRRRRCLVPVDGFYEWKKAAKTKVGTGGSIPSPGNRPGWPTCWSRTLPKRWRPSRSRKRSTPRQTTDRSWWSPPDNPLIPLTSLRMRR